MQHFLHDLGLLPSTANSASAHGTGTAGGTADIAATESTLLDNLQRQGSLLSHRGGDKLLRVLPYLPQRPGGEEVAQLIERHSTRARGRPVDWRKQASAHVLHTQLALLNCGTALGLIGRLVLHEALGIQLAPVALALLVDGGEHLADRLALLVLVDGHHGLRQVHYLLLLHAVAVGLEVVVAQLVVPAVLGVAAQEGQGELVQAGDAVQLRGEEPVVEEGLVAEPLLQLRGADVAVVVVVQHAPYHTQPAALTALWTDSKRYQASAAQPQQVSGKRSGRRRKRGGCANEADHAGRKKQKRLLREERPIQTHSVKSGNGGRLGYNNSKGRREVINEADARCTS